MDKNIIELIPENKDDVESTLEDKIVLDVLEGGKITDEFVDLISKDVGIKTKK